MPTKRAIDDFLAQQHIAFVGASRDPKNFANAVYRELRDHGRTLYPVNVQAETTTIEGDTCYRSLADVPDPIDGVYVMVSEAQAASVVRDAIERGVRRVWLHRGVGPSSVSAEAVQMCRNFGVSVVDGACPFMFDAPVRSVHRLHRMISAHRVARRELPIEVR